MAGVKLEKIPDIDMYLFIEKGLRWGISFIAKKYSKVNNKYMKNYDPTKPPIYIPYLDMNNLYSCGMNDSLPYQRFKWIEIDDIDVNSISEKSQIAYIFEVDLQYPNKLHALHKEYPLAPEKLTIPCDMLSDYCKNIADEYGTKVGDGINLTPNLGDKSNYILHHKSVHKSAHKSAKI